MSKYILLLPVLLLMALQQYVIVGYERSNGQLQHELGKCIRMIK